MGRQTLGGRQGLGGAGPGLRGLAGKANRVTAPHEVLNPEAGGEARGAARGQHVAGPGHVVTEHDRRRRADEDGAGIAHLVRARFRGRADQLQMLGRQPFGKRERTVQVGRDEGRAVRFERGSGGVPGRQQRELPVHLRRHPVGKRRGVRDQNRDRQGIVLRLRQQVGRNPLGGSAVGRHDDDLGRARVAVDAHVARHVLLRRRHPGVPGPGDQVDRPDGLGAVGERRDAVRAAHAPDLVRSDQVQHVPQHRALEVGLGRRGDDEFLDAREPCRHRGHQHRRRIREAPARHVDPDPADRQPALLDRHAVAFKVLDTRTVRLGPVVDLDGGTGAIDGGEYVGVDAFGSRMRAGAAQSQGVGRRRVEAVEAPDRFQQSRVAAAADTAYDLRGGAPDLGHDTAPAPPVEEFQALPPGTAVRRQDLQRSPPTELSHRRPPLLRARPAAGSAGAGGRGTKPG